MIVCTLVCDGCQVDLAVARHEDDCADPGSHGALLLGADGHRAYHADCCTLSVTMETEEEAEQRWQTEQEERRAGHQLELEVGLARSESDRERTARREHEDRPRMTS